MAGLGGFWVFSLEQRINIMYLRGGQMKDARETSKFRNLTRNDKEKKILPEKKTIRPEKEEVSPKTIALINYLFNENQKLMERLKDQWII